ncbi:threonylcarbamoyl-AMP synthase [Aristophania vespae]|uniref:Threonylcarbamoyl-AMP synthase n=1 Tax=Aristophania vespae TaxID=2697033 RepID=A0A6P1NG02_9PROT|nr:L-threonylcarbamoyladenylate synthase [Aristophania vespae]QHI95837.1 threonylcarbamoyl-AMP synthase [Aristophania vespae]UMM63554.1 Threonylcarbamoyl-AMP synthase [Aristophania vespae]
MTEFLDVSFDGIRRAADIIRYGGIVAFGTETVYGLGGLSTSRQAVSRIYAAKGRPSFNPLISHFASAEQAFQEVDLTLTPLGEKARELASHFWPGPLTLILPKKENSLICDSVSAALPTIAIRVPRGRAVNELLRLVNAPVAAPSANRSGRISPSSALHVKEELDGKIDAILDTGSCIVGLESTVLDLTGETPTLLRPGGLSQEELEAICGPVRHAAPLSQDQKPLAPGQLTSHYAPTLPIRLNTDKANFDEAWLSFGPEIEENHPLKWNLSPKGDLAEAAARLYAGLRYLDNEGQKKGVKAIAVSQIPQEGLGCAIFDRLQRAAAPRPI